MRSYGHATHLKLELYIVDAELVGETLRPCMIILHNVGRSFWSAPPERWIALTRRFGSKFAAFKIAGVGDKGSPITVDSKVSEIVGEF